MRALAYTNVEAYEEEEERIVGVAVVLSLLRHMSSLFG